MSLRIGMRKMKSVFAVFFSFLIWQGIRYFIPAIEVHPVFAYIYSIIEMRETPEQTNESGRLRIKATVIGLVVGLLYITLVFWFTRGIAATNIKIAIEIVMILMAILSSISVAELARCKNFCGIAAIITVICMVSHNEESIWLYAVMRVVQTLIGVFSAMVVNKFFNKRV